MALLDVVATNGLLLLSGVTGTNARGEVSPDPQEQFEQAFAHPRQYLAAAGATMESIVEMTTYHVGLREHLDDFMTVKDRHIHRPYPAWSAYRHLRAHHTGSARRVARCRESFELSWLNLGPSISLRPLNPGLTRCRL